MVQNTKTAEKYFKKGRKLYSDHKILARIYFKKAAEAGSVDGLYWIGKTYDSLGGDSGERKAAPYYLQAAEKGHAEAQCDYAYLCYNGRGVKKDEKAAIYWYEKAAEQGYLYAFTCLTEIYQDKDGVQNYEKMCMWAEKGRELSKKEKDEYRRDKYFKRFDNDYRWARKALCQSQKRPGFSV